MSVSDLPTSDRSAMDTTEFDVLIVGAGPVGLCFASALQATDLRIAIVEKKDADTLENPAFDGREITLTHTTVDRLNDIGVWAHIPADEVHRLKETKIYDGKTAKPLTFRQPKHAHGVPTDRLGYLVSNHLIKKAALTQAKNNANITWFTRTEITSVDLNADDVIGNACVVTAEGQRLYAKLIVASDSRFSQMRTQFGISSDRLDFGRSALAFRISHPQSEDETAYEFFRAGQTLSVLPLTPSVTSCVITAATPKVLALAQDADSVKQHLADIMGNRFGEVTIDSSLHSHPLVTAHAKRFVAAKGALIGDAAVGMHPITSHGFNLGFSSAYTLANLVTEAQRKQQHIGSDALLAEYERKHLRRSRPLYHTTNTIVSLFAMDNAPAKLLRTAVIQTSGRFPRVREMLTNMLVG